MSNFVLNQTITLEELLAAKPGTIGYFEIEFSDKAATRTQSWLNDRARYLGVNIQTRTLLILDLKAGSLQKVIRVERLQ